MSRSTCGFRSTTSVGRRLLAVTSGLALLAACHPPSAAVDSNPVPPPVPGSTRLTLGPGDVMEIRVFQETDLSSIYRVANDGTIDFPFCHKMQVAGRTPGEAAQKITDCLKPGYLVNPQVSVELKDYNSKHVSVFGEISKPGTIPFQPDLTALQVVLLSGGFSKLAAKNSVILVREVDGKEERYKVGIDDIAAGRAPNIPLQPGDILYVPESFF